MIIGIDIDDTICNTKELQRIYWKEYFNNNKCSEFSEELPMEVNYFNIPYIDEFWNTYRFKLFNPSIKEDVVNVINEFRELGFKFVIVTSRPPEVYDDLNGKIKKWLDSENLYVDDIFTGVRDKGQFILDNNIDILIDDDIRHVSRARELGKDVIHFTDDMTWLKVKDILKEYL